ncbi:MAG: nucleotide exchange factor GrpE [Cyanobacteriota bacterium]|jgi:molecular chaperone GrpE
MSGDATPFPNDTTESDGQAAVDGSDARTRQLDDAMAALRADGVQVADQGADGAAEAAEPAAAEGSGARVRELEEALAALRGEHDSLRGQYMRIAADFDNFRKRQSRDQEDLRLQIACSTLSEILPVVDNFERARQQLDPQAEEAQTIHRSYQGLYKQLVEVFKQLGVAPMRVEGEPFDPNLHEAVLREASDEHAEDVVIAELQRGYQLQGRVLRHALVKVSMGPGPSGGAAAQAEAQPAEHEA